MNKQKYDPPQKLSLNAEFKSLEDYLDEYIKKGSFLKILNKKDIFFNDSTSIVLTAAIGLMFLLILLSLYILSTVS